ncbi:MAG: disulfide bond formation protein B [Thermoflexaceae bacterium]|nr:disulfide bond formation protein B [Thermoflexaceae bacterium]
MISEETFSPLIATLSISVVLVALMAILVAELRPFETVRVVLYDHAQKGMLTVAAVAMASSLYYSEVANFTPCELCWFQRIAMYPLAVLLLVAVATRDRLGSRYVVALAAIGLSISIYHYQLQLFPDQAQVCSGGVVSCTVKFVDEFGFVSIPFMAGAGFLTILLLQVAEWRVDFLFKHDRP